MNARTKPLPGAHLVIIGGTILGAVNFFGILSTHSALTAGLQMIARGLCFVAAAILFELGADRMRQAGGDAWRRRAVQIVAAPMALLGLWCLYLGAEWALG